MIRSIPLIKRYSGNPILSYKDIPYKSALVFNPGVAKFKGEYVMLFRNDYGSREKRRIEGTNIGFARSDDGINWKVEEKPFIDWKDEEIFCVNDPRITVIEDRCYITLAVITKHGIRGGIGFTDNFRKFELISISTPDNRNFVLFPEKFSGKFLRLERPFPVYGRGGKEIFDIWISESPDMKYWGNSELLLGVEDVPFANEKIGPGAPPIKTEEGWLVIFHAVDFDSKRGKNGWENLWQKRYTAGIMLLDLENPRKVIKVYKKPILVPEALYEIKGGFRNNVIFPTGAILEKSGELKIYYGSADTTICLATANIQEILSLITGQI